MPADPAVDDAPAPVERSDPWALAAAVILSLATLASAWSGYQASRWNGAKTDENRAASVARADADRAADLADRQMTNDVTVFLSWVEATMREEDHLAAAIEARFTAEFEPAFELWRSMGTDEELADGSPFELAAYRLGSDVRSEELLDVAEVRALAADDASQTADNYVLSAVLFASVLFFAGIASKLSDARAIRLCIVLSGAMFVVAAAVMATLKVSVGF